MKKIFILLIMQAVAFVLFAQRIEPVNPQKDQIEYEGFTIRLKQAMGGTYGYGIIKGKELVILHNHNPFTNSPMGLNKKEDAYEVAKWEIQQIKSGGYESLNISENRTVPKLEKLPPGLKKKLSTGNKNFNSPRINQQLPLSVAKELKIDLR